MLAYAGRTVKITQSIAANDCPLPSDTKCAYNVILDITNEVVCKSITPVSTYTECAIDDLVITDILYLNVSSNVDFGYKIIAKVENIDKDPETHNHICPYVSALIAANISQLMMPRRKTVVELMPGYTYAIWQIINPWKKLYPELIIEQSKLTINYATHNDCFYIV